MDFPLIPVDSTKLFSGQREDRLSPLIQETFHPPWPTPAQTVILPAYKPSKNFLFSSETPRGFDGIDKPDPKAQWEQIPPGRIRSLYQKNAREKQPVDHRVDLYI